MSVESLPSTSTPSQVPYSAESGGVEPTVFPLPPPLHALHRRGRECGGDDVPLHSVTVYLHTFSPDEESDTVQLQLHKRSTTEELMEKVVERRKELAGYDLDELEMVEVMGTLDGQTFKERALDRGEYPLSVQTLWGRSLSNEDLSIPKNRFVLRMKGVNRAPITGGTRFEGNASSAIDAFLAKFLVQPQDREYADLCMLPELTEQTLLDNLRDRFASGHIYTYIGPILVAVNPFNFFPIYNPKYARMYVQSRRLGALPPHIFAIADITYHNMLRIKQNHCVVISGESGSGKTESTNFLLHHLTTLSQKGTSTTCCVEQTLLCAGPVLEAFGNAVTLQNNNSSRFGKFIRVNYRENGMVSGATVEIYLLEKSRIISQAAGESNYHVFYYLLQGASAKLREELFLLPTQSYNYLNQSACEGLANMNGRHEFDRLSHSMQAVGFGEDTQKTIFSIISAVLLLGNINFVKRPGYHSDETAYVQNEEVVDIIASLLRIRGDHLLQALTMRKSVMRAETLITRYSLADAINTRDAMAKCLYNSLFHWIVLKVNEALLRTETLKGYYIGILDIFGFEDVGSQFNSFEQLCINYANEHLQAYFNQHIFQFEQEEYLKEGISWTNIEYTDNTECVQLFQNKPYGILRLIDEESQINSGTDQSMLDKLNQFLKSNEYYEVPQRKEQAFIVAHYAGKVKYQIVGFREKNKDLMRSEIAVSLKGSRSSVVRQLLSSDPVAVFRWTLLRNTWRAVSAFKQTVQRMQRSGSTGHLNSTTNTGLIHNRRSSDSQLSAFLRGELKVEIPDFCDTSMFDTIVHHAKRGLTKSRTDERHSTVDTLKIVKEVMGNRVSSKKAQSVSKQFQHSLNRLMKTLGHATPYFIRCIKSNNEKVANHFDDRIILRQLRYTGMLETVRIRRAGYSVRIEYSAFVKLYRILLPKGSESTVEDIKVFIRGHPLVDTNCIQYGITKMFMRDAEKLILDDELHRSILKHIHTLQNAFRTHIARTKYIKLRQGIIRMQALVRGVLTRSRISRQATAALTIQSNWRRTAQQKKYKLIRDTVLALQSTYRGNVARRRLAELTDKPKDAVPSFNISKIHTFQLPTFNLNDPGSLQCYASSSEESLGDTTQDLVEEDEMADSLDADAAFILEDTKLKLVEETGLRRQSLAPTASTSKLKMLRRAASTESEQMLRKEGELSREDTKKKTTAKLGFVKAKNNLKALFGVRRSESGPPCDDESQPGPSSELSVCSGTVSGHSLKVTRLHRSELCSICCGAVAALLTQTHKCSRCKLAFHKECVAFAVNVACLPTSPLRSPTRLEGTRRPWDLPSLKYKNASPPSTQSFNLTNTKQQTDSSDVIVSSTEDLRLLSVFIFKKQGEMESEKKKRDTVVDAIFKKALRGLHMELIGYEAVVSEDGTVLKYNDIINTFGGLLTKACKEDKVSFPTTLGLNAFRGFLNQFCQQQLKRKKNQPRGNANILRSVRKKRRRSDVTVVFNGHRFRADIVHVPTYCECCDQFMWHAEKIFICSTCRISVHKKCHTKVEQVCSMANVSQTSSRFFGANLSSLGEDETGVPIILSKMLMTLELRALFIEGLYRKSGGMAQVRQCRGWIESTSDVSSLSFDQTPPHIVTTLVKAFLRELPEPLMTFDMYENFLNASDIEDTCERLRCLSVMVELLPKGHKCVLDRLLFHLARVAHQEAVNRMGSSNLALIFGPCLMRRNIALHAQDQLNDVHRQAICVGALVEEKLRQYRITLNNIVLLEDASEKVNENLRRIDERESAEKTNKTEAARQLFVEQLDFLDRHKERLIGELPPLAPVASSEDLSSSSERSHKEEYAVDLNLPPVFSTLHHATKGRVRGPSRRRPPSSPHKALA